MPVEQTVRVAGSLAAAALLSAGITTGSAWAGHPAGHPATSRVVTASTARRGTIANWPAGFIVGAVAHSLSLFDLAIHHRASLRVIFMPMNTPYFPSIIERNERLGAQTVLELKPVHLTMARIAAGSDDAWLRKWLGPHIAAFGKPITLSFGPEMNGQWYSYGTHAATPAQYVRAYRHVHQVLAATAGGRLISWMWQPSAIHFSTSSPAPYWPGWRYVNVIALDGYYNKPGDTFSVIFGRTIAIMRSITHRPVIIGEVGVGPATRHMAADIRDLFAGMKRYRVIGLVYFNIDQHAGIYHQAWRLQDHPLALRAFIAQVAAATARHGATPA